MTAKRESDRDANRRNVASAVARLAAERGIDAITLRAVAAEACTSMGNIQYRFGTVADLIVFSLDSVIAEIDKHVDDVDAYGQRLLGGTVDALLNDDPLLRTSILAYAQLRTSAARDARCHELIAAFQARRTAVISAILADARSKRILHTLVEPEREADVFWTLLLAMAIEVAQGLRTREDARTTLRYHFLRLARNRRVTRPPRVCLPGSR